jgi:hypothetical protein
MPNYSGIWTEQAVMQANGAGNWPNAPGAPTIGTATDTTNGGSVSVAFTAPTFAGLPAVITSYTVTSNPGGLTGTGASSPITVSGLTNGTAYTFTVTATNASGTSAASAASNSVTPSLVVYIEQTFSTYLYTGNGSTQTITNGINLSANGGLVWAKSRSVGNGHALYDTVRGINKALFSQGTNAEYSAANLLTAFNSNGFTLGSDENSNGSGGLGASWTFRKQPKFFDVLTYTGTGSNTTIAHSLGSVPACIIVKRTDTTGAWQVYHRSLANTEYLVLNTTAAKATGATRWNSTTPTSTVFSLGTDATVNSSGGTYVAYIFAHDAGGFGLTGTDNVISCGSYTGTGSAGNTVTLGYEPQWLLVKNASAEEGDGWVMLDVMRGMPNFFATDQSRYLSANSGSAEQASNLICPTATGFYIDRAGNPLNTNAQTYIYIAIRRGPMAVPTVGTSVFSPLALSNTTGTKNTTGFPVDLQINAERGGVHNTFVVDRLRGVITNDTDTASPYLKTNATSAEATDITALTRYWDNTGFMTASYLNSAGTAYWNFKRAPSFFDEVCFTGPTSGSTTQTHNLAAVPELMIVRPRSVGSYWYVYVSSLGISKYLALNLSDAVATSSNFWVTAPTSTAFTCSVDNMGSSGANRPHVAYLFATCAGVSKVGSYTGTGAAQTINCGFTAGSRFVLIKRTDSTGDWYVWDSARGIIAGNDPYLLLNDTAAEVTNTDYVDTAATGFEISSTAPAAINANGGTFIFLAIA